MQLPLQMQDLNLSYCDQITSNAWEVLQTANWSSLKKAFFQERPGQEKGVEGSTCIVLLVLIQIPTES